MGQKANEGKIQKPIRFDKWMADAIQEIANKKKLTFTAIVHELLRQELAIMGYSMGIGREAELISGKEKTQKQATQTTKKAG